MKYYTNTQHIKVRHSRAGGTILNILCLLSVIVFLTGCASTLDKLEQVGHEPPLTKTENPQARPDYKPMSWPLPEPIPPTRQHANSLWQPGARAFFRDYRAARVGDILKVRIQINDRAQVDNETERRRDTEERLNAPSFFGFESEADNILPGTPDTNNLASIRGRTLNRGIGGITRQERITTDVPAVITQVLPNGNFVISGSQEIRVNFEIREVGISGIIRPEDIDSSNTIQSTQVAEARIVYGGRGQLNDIQQPRWGNQVIDILSPF
jgi:flagellar L-ring protein precursor FlgH